MDYTMEDSQNSAPGSVSAAKLGGARKGPDGQSVTKRYGGSSPVLLSSMPVR